MPDLLPGTARVFVIESGGGQARQIGADLAAALYPVWSPAGDQVLVLGRAAAGAGAATDWLTLPVQHGPAQKDRSSSPRWPRNGWCSPPGTPISCRWNGAPRASRVRRRPRRCRQPLGDRALRRTMWKAPPFVSHKLPGYQLHASTAGDNARGRLAFSSLEWKPEVWSQALDADRGIATGEPVSITIDEPSSLGPSLSADGRYLVYLSNQLGARSVRARDLTSGKAITLVSSPAGFFNPRVSGDGASVAYSDRNGNIFFVPRSGGAVETLCAGCGTTMAVSTDGKRVSYEPAQSEDLTYYDVERKARVTVAQRPDDSVLTDGRFSPDGKWMAFHARTKQTTAQVFVVPIDGALPVPRQQWIAVTDGGSEEMEPAWSPNGELLYFLSDRDGFRCIWARRLNAAGKQPTGAAFALRHFHRARRSLRRMTSTTGLIGLSVAPGRMVFSFGELTGNIWLEEKLP